MIPMHQTSTNDDNEAEADYVKSRGAFEETLDAQFASNVARCFHLFHLEEGAWAVARNQHQADVSVMQLHSS